MVQVVSTTQVDSFYLPKLCASEKCHNDPQPGSRWCDDCLTAATRKRIDERIPHEYQGEKVFVIYFITAPSGHVKIGKTKNLKRRLGQLQAYSPVKLTASAWFIGNESYETGLHDLFHGQRSHYEWFEINDEIQRFMDKLNAGESPSGLACSGVSESDTLHFGTV